MSLQTSNHVNAKMQICYLCSESIGVGEGSEDHALPKQFIKHRQPLARGFAYAGKLPTHRTCNNRFGPERYCQAALKLLEFIHARDEEIHRIVHDKELLHSYVPLKLEQIDGVSAAERRFFGFPDAPAGPEDEYALEKFILGKLDVDPLLNAHNTILSVLAKTAASLLLKAGIIEIQKRWKILLVALMDFNEGFDIEKIFGFAPYYEVGLQIYSGLTETGDGVLVMRIGKLLVFTLIATGRNRGSVP